LQLKRLKIETFSYQKSKNNARKSFIKKQKFVIIAQNAKETTQIPNKKQAHANHAITGRGGGKGNCVGAQKSGPRIIPFFLIFGL